MGTYHAALVLSASGRFEIGRVERGLPTRPGVLLAPRLVGVCGTDLDIARRSRSDSAEILGHEGHAEVLHVSPGVTGIEVGQQVIFNPVNPLNPDDILGHSRDGILQEQFWANADDIDRGMLVPMDSDVPRLCAPLAEPLGTAIYGQSLVSRVCDARTVAVIGAGPIGLTHSILARTRGASTVILVDVVQDRLDYAVAQGFVTRDEIMLDSESLTERLLGMTLGRGVDAAYLCTTRYSASGALRKALTYVRASGCIDLVVGFPDGEHIAQLPAVELNAIRRSNSCGSPAGGVVKQFVTGTGREIWLTGHRGTSRWHLHRAMRMLAQEPAYQRIISHVLTLTGAATVLDQLVSTASVRLDGRPCVKVLIDMEARAD